MKRIYLFKPILFFAFTFLLSISWSQLETTFTYTGAPETFVVPPGVVEIQVEAWGAQGQALTDEDYDGSTGGLGGYAVGILSVTPGEVLNIYVGGTGSEGVGGFNGGGVGGYGTPSTGSGGYAGSGGGASDIRQGGVSLGDRVIVAGGGGGGGRDYVNGTCVPCGTGGNGGAGGALVGVDGDDPNWSGLLGEFPNVGAGGKGGTGVAGGAAGDGPNGPPGQAGVLGVGGDGVDGTQSVASGGGGGGYYGGGSGGGANSGNGVAGGGGAGGSSYITGLTDASTLAGVRTGNGEVKITVLCTPLAITATATEICLGEEITLDAESGVDGEITWDMGVEDEVAFTPEETGVITYTATSDADGDCAGTIEITVYPEPTVLAGSGDEVYCDGETIVLSAGGDADSYSWDPLDLEPGPGTYTYTLTGTSEIGCEATDEVTVTVHALPSVTASADYETVCESRPITLTGGGATSYSWDMGVTDGDDFIPGPIGTYTYTVTGTDDNGCENTASIEVTVVEGISISYSTTDEIMGGDGAIDITVTGGVPTYLFDWNNDGTGDFDDPEDLTSLSGGSYTVSVEGSTGCTANETIMVNSQLSIEESSNNSVSVYPNPTSSNISIETDGSFTYQIVNINGQILLNGTANNVETLNLESFAPGVYFVNLTNDNQVTTVKFVKK